MNKESQSIHELIKERILILDGAMGTSIQAYALKEKDFRGEAFIHHSRPLTGNNDILNITAPHVIEAIHDSYINAGADIIETNTFNANAISQADYGCEANVDAINRAAVAIAKRSASKVARKVFIAGSVGPTNKTLTLASDITHPEYRSVDFDTLADAYHCQIHALLDAGVDLLLIETVFDALNVKAALYALMQVEEELGKRVPVMISVTINDQSGRTLTGQCIDALYSAVSHYPLFSFGLNCSFGASMLHPFIAQISASVPCAVSVYPNAGLPNEMGQYDEAPDFTSVQLSVMAKEGLLNIAGGCCGTTPAHIRAIAQALAHIAPRRLPQLKSELTVSGLENVVIDKSTSNFVNIGERTNVAGSRKFARLIREKKYNEAIEIAKNQIEAGARIIDINMDDALLDSTQEMTNFVRILNNEPDVAKAALMIDSSHWPTIIAGLKNSQGKCIVNSISLKDGESAFLAKAKELKQLGAAVVVMAFDETGQATTYEQKIAIAQRAYLLLKDKIGFPTTDIIFDSNILTVGTGIDEHAAYGVDYIRAVEWIKQHLPGVKCSGGVSNLSFAFRGNNVIREAMHSVFLYHAIKAGLDMAIVNPEMLQIYDEIAPDLLKAVEDVVLNKSVHATEHLIELTTQLKNQASDEGVSPVVQRRDDVVEKRLSDALIKGTSTYLQEDIQEALLHYDSPVAIIEGPLLKGMEHVGELFGSGKMFLPQVVKSARVMQEAVALLQPYLKQDSVQAGRQKQRILLATAKGDVHDIGKNIVKIVLTCNNYEVIDLGVMVENHKIVEAIRTYHPNAVGISGLITPSLKEMEALCDLLTKEQITIPLFVGGATTSVVHTAVKLAPRYEPGVVYGGDASRTVTLLKRLLAEGSNYIDEIKQEQDTLRKAYYNAPHHLLSLKTAQSRAFRPTNNEPAHINTSPITLKSFPIEQLVPFIDWTPFFHFWGIKGVYPQLIADNSEAKKLHEDALEALRVAIDNKDYCCSALVRFEEAYRRDEAISMASGITFPMLRQQSDDKVCYSLADFYDDKVARPFGLFVVGVSDLKADELDKTSYTYLLRTALAGRLTEAFAEYLQKEIASDEPMIRPALGYPCCPDHSMKRMLFDYLDVERQTDLRLTSHYSILPSTALCGFFIPHQQGRYFSIHAIDQEQYDEYVKRRNFTAEEGERLLGFLLAGK